MGLKRAQLGLACDWKEAFPNAPWCWNIYQHFPQKSSSLVGKYTSTMEQMGFKMGNRNTCCLQHLVVESVTDSMQKWSRQQYSNHGIPARRQPRHTATCPLGERTGGWRDRSKPSPCVFDEDYTIKNPISIRINQIYCVTSQWWCWWTNWISIRINQIYCVTSQWWYWWILMKNSKSMRINQIYCVISQWWYWWKNSISIRINQNQSDLLCNITVMILMNIDEKLKINQNQPDLLCHITVMILMKKRNINQNQSESIRFIV